MRNASEKRIELSPSDSNKESGGGVSDQDGNNEKLLLKNVTETSMKFK